METLCEKSKKHFGTTNDLKEAGYILADGIMLDFTGRHYACGYEKGKPTGKDYLKGERSCDHREVSQIIESKKEISGDEAMTSFMNDCKAIRVLSGGGKVFGDNVTSLNINFIGNVTPKQEEILSSHRGEAYIDIDNSNGRTICSKSFDNFNIRELKKMISECSVKK